MLTYALQKWHLVTNFSDNNNFFFQRRICISIWNHWKLCLHIKVWRKMVYHIFKFPSYNKRKKKKIFASNSLYRSMHFSYIKYCTAFPVTSTSSYKLQATTAYSVTSTKCTQSDRGWRNYFYWKVNDQNI